MSQAVRERTNELGVLKSIGYSDILIMIFVLMESIFLCLIGAYRSGDCLCLFPLFSGVALGFAGQIEFSFSIVLSAIAFGFINSYHFWIVTSVFSHEIERSRCFEEKLI